MMNGYELVAGLEIHAQLLTRTKAFCRCQNQYGASPNTLVCPVCLGTPGALPVLNREVVVQAAKLALALGAQIHLHSRFDRKNYFYPDLPKGYQISQFEHPFSTGGSLNFAVSGSTKSINITRAHIEEDAGKSMHLADGSTIVDLNRSGVPLIEIVSEPEFRSGEEAAAYLTAIRELLRFIGVCDGNMDEGSLRCDANVSVRKVGETGLRERTEMKNLNSVRSVERGIKAEAKRQIEIYEHGGVIKRQTLKWNEESETLKAMRVKEGSDDYRYFPEPDLPELRLSESFIELICRAMPELPEKRRQKYRSYGLHEEAVYLLATDRSLSDYFEELIAGSRSATSVAAWIQGDVQRLLKENHWEFSQFPVTAARLGELIDAVESRMINRTTGKELLRKMISDSKSVAELISETGAAQIQDSIQIKEVVASVLLNFPSELAKFREGNTKVVSFFMGQVMQATKGHADPILTKRVLMDLLEEKE